MANLFDNAAKVATPDPKTTNKKGMEEHYIGRDLDTLAAIDAVMESLDTMRKTFYANVTDAMVDKFVEDTIITKVRPKNFRGTGEISDAACELKKRASNRPLSTEEMLVLTKHKITTETAVVTPAQEQRYFFNPEIVANAKLADKISKALSQIPELKGMQILMVQEAVEQKTAEIVNDTTFADVAKIVNPAALKDLYKIIATTSIKAKVTVQDMDTIFQTLKTAGIKLSADDKKTDKKAKK